MIPIFVVTNSNSGYILYRKQIKNTVQRLNKTNAPLFIVIVSLFIILTDRSPFKIVKAINTTDRKNVSSD
jgi:hypothetical protein